MVKPQLYLILFTGTNITHRNLFILVYLALNLFRYSNANYIGKANFKDVLKNKIEFKCQYTDANGNGQFFGWYKGKELINNDQKDHYSIENTAKETKLIITWSKYLNFLNTKFLINLRRNRSTSSKMVCSNK
jgi:hypothetical protein